jgi:hypothetical protein
MNEYNYREAITADIIDYIEENYTREELAEKLTDREAFADELNDELWACDSVTGNASGSYFFNRYQAEEALCHNWYLLADALEEFGCADANAFDKGAEWCDVTIRCYLLWECIWSAVMQFN